MHIVRALLDSPLGFNELGPDCGGCNPATLKVRLNRLEHLGLLRRTVHSMMPPLTSYEPRSGRQRSNKPEYATCASDSRLFLLPADAAAGVALLWIRERRRST